MTGRVRRGQQLGRKLGYPTANLALHRKVVPLWGIFAVRVCGAGLVDHPAVVSLGTRPTINGTDPLLEVHLFDFDGDLYGQYLERRFRASPARGTQVPSRSTRWSSRCTSMRPRRAGRSKPDRARVAARPGAALIALSQIAESLHNFGFRASLVRALMSDYKNTINLPETAFPMKADLARREPDMLAWWEERGHLREAARGRDRAPDVRPARRAAVRERRDPHRPRRQQGAEGHHRQVAHARRLRRALRAGLGLPRPADRAPGREDARPRGEASSMPRRSARPAASSRSSRSTCSARTSSASASWATGRTPTSRWRRATRPSSCARSRRSSATGTSTRATSPCTGASTAARRSPRPKSSTRSAPRHRSMCVSRSSIARTSRIACTTRRCRLVARAS